ncbi:histidinol-phosphatase HisJ family protein [Rosistilla ulvae]|nr:histidinol-phosphatase HisJ family protein [Rosistilla ulvae]
MIYESHSHTPLCKHAQGTPTEYAAAAHRAGMPGITITCHNPMPDRFSVHVRMDPEQWDEYIRIVAQAAEEWRGKVDVRLGLEADYYPGHVDFVRKQIAENPLSYVIGSVHPQTPEYRRDFRTDDPLRDQITYFNMLADAAETGLFDCISHPDLIKNETPDDWQTERLLDTIARVLDRIAASNTAMELNTSGRYKKITEMNPFPQMLQMMHEREIPVVIGADAHVPDRVGEGYPEALALLQQAGYDEVLYFIDRQPQRVAISQALQYDWGK